MADANAANFGGADGGDTVDIGSPTDDGRDLSGAAGNGEPGSPSDPLAHVKRGRGRPRKDASSSGTTGGGQQAGKSGGTKAKPLDVTLFAAQLMGAHQMIALVTKNPIWIISEKEASALAKALVDVMAYHSIDINPATLAYVKLIGAIAMIHGSRFMMLQKQKRDEAARTVDM